jgi:DNA-binding CsgD family transcriptional regulator
MLFCDLKKTTTRHISPYPFQGGHLTENILALNDSAVLLTEGKNAVVHCSESISTILGIQARQVIDCGWRILYERIHPCDQKLLGRKLLPDIRRFLRQASLSDRHRLAFDYTFRIRSPDNRYIVAAMKNRILRRDGHAGADMHMSVLKNITAFGDRSRIYLTVRRNESNWLWTRLLQKEYWVQAEGFSTRETQIIHCIASGLSSKDIGDRFSISPETVRCHRKRIMQRSGCKSSAELVSFALREGIV